MTESISTAFNSLTAADIASLLVSVALVVLTAVLARYTRMLAIEAKKARELQTSPNVIVTAVHDESRPTIIMLVVQNIGKGMALDVSFMSSVPLQKAYGISEETKRKPQPIDRGPLVTGIPALGPGESRKMDWGQPGGLLKLVGSEAVTIECKYTSQEGHNYSGMFKVDIESFMMTNANESMPLRTVKALENIADNTKKALSKL